MIDGYHNNHIYSFQSLARYYWLSSLRVEFKRGCLYCDAKEDNNFIVDESDPNFDIAYYLALDGLAQVSNHNTNDLPENIESYGFVSNSIKIKHHPLHPVNFEEPIISSHLDAIE